MCVIFKTIFTSPDCLFLWFLQGKKVDTLALEWPLCHNSVNRKQHKHSVSVKLTLKLSYLGVPVSAACASTLRTCGEFVNLTLIRLREIYCRELNAFYPSFIVSALFFPPLLQLCCGVLEDHTSFPVRLIGLLPSSSLLLCLYFQRESLFIFNC